ncbi:MAG: 3-dehydroquinate synthase [Planctomycetaceae bacterium]|nr:3-dehydroquinate synthase [Planctomycetaceae bacterium]
MLTIDVDLKRPSHSYSILLESGLCADWRAQVESRLASSSYLALVDANLAEAHDIPSHGCMEEKWRYLWVQPGEENKHLEQYAALCEDALHFGITRDTVLVAVGGGVTGDIAGFVASTLLRGLRLVQIPTTLLAQVDSSVGGKNGVNAEAGKNMVGTIHQPSLVLIDPAVLDSLPRREYLAGVAEIVKTAVLDSAEFFSELQKGSAKLSSGDHEFIADAIARCCRIKSGFVKDDERDTGRRQLLNLGHTFGHVLESLAGYDGSVVHGEAVAVGMVLACRFSVARSTMKQSEADAVETLLATLGLPTCISQLGADRSEPIEWSAALSSDDAVAVIAADKKAESSGVNLVLPHAIGDCRLEKGFPPADILRFMHDHINGGW